MSLCAYVLADVIHLIKIILVCDLFFMFGKREGKHKKIILAVATILMSMISIIIYSCRDKFIGMLVYVIAIVLLLCVLYKEKILNMVVSAIWIIVIMSMLDTMSLILFETLANLFRFMSDSISRMGTAVISLVVVFSLGKIYNKQYQNGIKTIGKLNLLVFTALTVVNTFVVMVIATIAVRENQDNRRIIYSIAFIIAILGIFLQLGAVILLLMQRNIYKEKKQVTEKYLNEQKSHYEYLEKRETETKKFRHDLRSHMQMLSNLAKNGQYDKFDEYLEKINIKIERLGNAITVQNGIVDAIINQYYSKAMQSGIKMEVNGRFPHDCTIDAYDLCTIFSNVLSNALEAAVETAERIIIVECRYTENNIIIVVRNSFNNVGQFENDKIKSHKEDVDYHGYGLENIKDSIEKYDGVLDIEVKNNMFIMTILFNNTEKRSYENSNYR